MKMKILQSFGIVLVALRHPTTIIIYAIYIKEDAGGEIHTIFEIITRIGTTHGNANIVGIDIINKNFFIM